MDLRDLLGRSVQYRPSGTFQPIGDDRCQDPPCRGIIVEVGKDDNLGKLRIEWEFTCNVHESPSFGEPDASWEHSVDIALM